MTAALTSSHLETSSYTDAAIERQESAMWSHFLLSQGNSRLDTL